MYFWIMGYSPLTLIFLDPEGVYLKGNIKINLSCDPTQVHWNNPYCRLIVAGCWLCQAAHCIRCSLCQGAHCIRCWLYQVLTVSGADCIRCSLYQVLTVSGAHCIRCSLYQVLTVSGAHCIRCSIYVWGFFFKFQWNIVEWAHCKFCISLLHIYGFIIERFISTPI